MQEKLIQNEKQRLIQSFPGAGDDMLKAFDGLIEEMAFVRVQLQELRKTAKKTGLVRINPDNPVQQEELPIAKVITRLEATYANGMDKLSKRLAVDAEEDDDDLAEFE